MDAWTDSIIGPKWLPASGKVDTEPKYISPLFPTNYTAHSLHAGLKGYSITSENFLKKFRITLDDDVNL